MRALDRSLKSKDDGNNMPALENPNKLVDISVLYDRLAAEGITSRKNAANWWQYQLRKGRIPSLFPAYARKKITVGWVEEIVKEFRPGGSYRWSPKDL